MCQNLLLTRTATGTERCLFLMRSQANPLTSGPKAATDACQPCAPSRWKGGLRFIPHDRSH